MFQAGLPLGGTMAGITLGDAIFFFRGDRTDVTQKLGETERLVKDGSGRINGFLRDALAVALGNTIAAGLQAATSAIGGFFAGTVSAAASFEERLSGIKAVLSPTTAEMEKLRAKALELGQSTAFSASQSAEAIEMLAKNGLDATAILNGAADATVALAAATGAELSTAADIMTDAMAIFGIEAENASAAIDGITGVTVASKFSINDYRLALAQAGGVAASVGVEFGDFNTAIAAISPLFASGSDAGTSFKTMLQRLIPASGPAKQAMQELGLIAADGSNQFFTASGQLKDMSEVAGILQAALAPLSEEQKNLALSTIFGTDAMRAAVGLANVGTEGFNELAASMAEVDAAAQAATRLDNFNGALEQARGAAETLQITLGSYLLPVLTQLLNNVVTPGINLLTTLTNAVAGNAEAFAQLPAPLQTVVTGLQAVVQWVMGLRAPLNSIAEGVVAFGERLAGVAPLAQAIFRQLADQARGWGQNITGQLAVGIGQAVSAVVAQLQRIGAIIRHWLKPNSPPLIVPELDEYGRAAAQLYADSWGDADFSALRTLGKAIEDVLSDLVDMGQLDQTELIPTLLGGRDALSRAITEFREFGDVSEESLQAIVDAAGPAGPAVEGLVRAYFELERATADVAAAQADLNQITAEYNAVLDPLNAELDAIRDRQQEIRDLQRIEKLQKQLAEGKLDDREAELARLEIAEIQKRQQIEGIEDERDAAIEAAEEKLDAAEAEQRAARERYDQQQALLDSQQEQNDLIQQQIDLLARLAEEQRKAAEAAATAAGAGGGSGGGGGGVESLLGAIGAPPSAAQLLGLPTPDEAAAPIAAIKERIDQELSDAEYMAQAALERGRQQAAQAIETQAAEILGRVGAFFASIPERIAEGIGRIQEQAPAIQEALRGPIVAGLTFLTETVPQHVSTFVQAFVDGLLGGNGGWDRGRSWVREAMPTAEETTGLAGEQAGQLVQGLLTALPGWIDGLRQGLVTFLGSALPARTELTTAAGTLIAGLIEGVGQYGPGIITALGGLFLGLGEVIVSNAPAALAGIADMLSLIIGAIGEAAPGLLEAVGQWALALAQFAVQAAPGLLANLWSTIAQVLDAIGQALPGIVEALARWGAEFINWVIVAAPQLLGQLLALAGQIIQYIVDRSPAIREQLAVWARNFVDWVTETAPKLLAALLVMAGQLISFIAEHGPKIATEIGLWAVEFVAWVAETAPKVIYALGVMFGELLGFLIEQRPKVEQGIRDIGNALVDGIKKGIQEKWEALKSWFRGLLDALIKSGKDEIESKSPSRRSARELGSPIVEGIIVGIEAMWPELVARTTELFDGLLKQLEDVRKQATDLLRDSFLGGLQGESSVAQLERRTIDQLRRFADERLKIVAELQDAEAEVERIMQERRDAATEHFRKDAELRQQLNDEEQKAAERRAAIERDYTEKLEDNARKQEDLRRKIAAEQKAERRADLERQLADAERAAERLFTDRDEKLRDEERRATERREKLAQQIADEQQRYVDWEADAIRRLEAAEASRRSPQEIAQIAQQLALIDGKLQSGLAVARDRMRELQQVDGRLAADYFQKQTAYLFELAELRKQATLAQNITDRAAAEQQIALLERQMEAERRLLDDRAQQAIDRAQGVGSALTNVGTAFADSLTRLQEQLAKEDDPTKRAEIERQIAAAQAEQPGLNELIGQLLTLIATQMARGEGITNYVLNVNTQATTSTVALDFLNLAAQPRT